LFVKAEAVSDRGRLAAAGHAKLGKNAGDVDAGGLLGDVELLADLPVGLAGGEQRGDLGLTSGQAKGGSRGC
jgi:hypothetical protein